VVGGQYVFGHDHTVRKDQKIMISDGQISGYEVDLLVTSVLEQLSSRVNQPLPVSPAPAERRGPQHRYLRPARHEPVTAHH
jgi:hypothetical protein